MKQIFESVLILTTLIIIGQSEPIRKENTFRIVDGVTAAPVTTGKSGIVMKNDGQYPYIASLRTKSRLGTLYRCSAVIVKEDIIFTAAHCTQRWQPTDLIVRAGSFTRKDVEDEHVQMRNVKKFINHPEHRKAVGSNNDLSIVWLEKPFELGKYINTIKLARDDYAGEDVLFVGWGDNYTHYEPEFLMKADFVVLEQNDCIKAYRPIGKDITYSMVCAIHKYMLQGVCNGDSGGPLIYQADDDPKNDLLIGTTSWGLTITYLDRRGNKTIEKQRCETSYPSVFARLEYLRPWIEKYVQLD